jgi:probable addiction module antidote protein
VRRQQVESRQRHQAGESDSSAALKGNKMVKVSKFDAADYLKNPVAIAAYLTEAFETNDPVYILTAFDTVARAKGIAEISKATGLSRESLYKTFKETARPEFDTVRKVMGSFGVKLVAEPIAEQKVA